MHIILSILIASIMRIINHAECHQLLNAPQDIISPHKWEHLLIHREEADISKHEIYILIEVGVQIPEKIQVINTGNVKIIMIV